jgi:hypothetical protein
MMPEREEANLRNATQSHRGFDKIAGSDFERPQAGPEGGGHDCRDAGGRAMPGAIAEDARSNPPPSTILLRWNCE